MNAGPDNDPRLPLLSGEDALFEADRIGIDPKYLTQPIWLMLLARPKYAKALYAVLTDLLFRSTIPVRLREVLIMREYGELSYAQIASSLAIPTGTVMSRLSRARDDLRRAWIATHEGSAT